MHTHCIPTLAVTSMCTVFLSFAVCLSLALFSFANVEMDGKCQTKGTKKVKTCVIVYVSRIVSRQLNLVISFFSRVRSSNRSFHIRFKWHIIKDTIEHTIHIHTHAIASTSSSCLKRIHSISKEDNFTSLSMLKCCFAKWNLNAIEDEQIFAFEREVFGFQLIRFAQVFHMDFTAVWCVWYQTWTYPYVCALLYWPG